MYFGSVIGKVLQIQRFSLEKEVEYEEKSNFKKDQGKKGECPSYKSRE